MQIPLQQVFMLIARPLFFFAQILAAYSLMRRNFLMSKLQHSICGNAERCCIYQWLKLRFRGSAHFWIQAFNSDLCKQLKHWLNFCKKSHVAAVSQCEIPYRNTTELVFFWLYFGRPPWRTGRTSPTEVCSKAAAMGSAELRSHIPQCPGSTPVMRAMAISLSLVDKKARGRW